MPLSPSTRARIRDLAKATDLELIAAVLLLVFFAWAFIELSDAPGEMNRRILVALRQPTDPSRGLGGLRVERMIRDITALGSGTIAILFSAYFIGWLLMTRRPGAALVVAIAMLGAWGLNELLKEAYARDRPDVVPHLIGAWDPGAPSPSFPSGHTMSSAVLYPMVAELIGRIVQTKRVRLYLMSIAISTALLVGFSRVYLGVHYPSDVLGGLVAGFAWALVCGIAVRFLQRRRVFRTRAIEGAPCAEAPS